VTCWRAFAATPATELAEYAAIRFDHLHHDRESGLMPNALMPSRLSPSSWSAAAQAEDDPGSLLS
jgi:hypothetical protein